MATKLLFRAEDLLDLQSTLNKRLELVKGELYEVSTGWRHGEVMGRIYSLLDFWNRMHKAGRVACDAGVILERDPDTVRGPDVSFVRKGRISAEQARRGFVELAPDLAVEVKSPNDTWASQVAKAQEYLAKGTALVLLVRPDEYAEVHRPGQQPLRLGLDDIFTAEDVLPGFAAPIRDFFPETSE
ncbi:MAG TPA: Uma2 family endonuclease [Chloroflexota bacterium]|nr:Uma2 family endonuclease [Chloroflexota bacterium]